VAGNVVGGAVATAGAIATAPFRAFDNSYNYDNSNNYYGYGYGGRDWKTYAAHNKLACTPGTTFKGPDGQPTSLHNSVFSTIPGSPAYVGKASSYKADAPALGIKLDLHGHNSVQGSFRFVC